MKRDVGRRKVYAAEWACERYGLRASPFAGLEELREAAGRVLRTRWWRNRYPRLTPEAVRLELYQKRHPSGLATAWPRERLIRFRSPDGLTFPILLHELAHLAEPGEHHGRAWRRTYIEMVRRFIGPAEALELDRAMREKGLRTSRPRKRATTPEQRERLRVRCFSNNLERELAAGDGRAPAFRDAEARFRARRERVLELLRLAGALAERGVRADRGMTREEVGKAIEDELADIRHPADRALAVRRTLDSLVATGHARYVTRRIGEEMRWEHA